MADYALTAESSTPWRSRSLLRRALLFDAGACAASALLVLVAAGWLSPWLGLSETFLRWVAILLLPFVALVLVAVSRPRVIPVLIGSVIIFNVVWVLASVAVLVSGAVSPTNLGVAIVIGQAAMVAGIARLQYLGWRRERSATP